MSVQIVDTDSASPSETLRGTTMSLPKENDLKSCNRLCRWLQRRGVRVTSTKGTKIRITFTTNDWIPGSSNGVETLYYRGEPSLFVDSYGVGKSKRRITRIIQ